MSSACILTDSTAQFTQLNFPGRERVAILPFHLREVRAGEEPVRRAACLEPPGPQVILERLEQLGRAHDGILVLTLSSRLNPLTDCIAAAAAQAGNHGSLEVVDSQSAGLGLGLLVERAAGLLAGGMDLREVVHRVRAAIPHIYLLFCIPELSYLARAGLLAHSQALVGELLGLLPVFTLEDGCLTPMVKVRTPRHLFESFQEFIGEFDRPERIVLMRGTSQTTLRSRPLRQYVEENFPHTPFSEHAIQPHLAGLFGPQSLGLVIQERASERI